jgi:hypothetical protein
MEPPRPKRARKPSQKQAEALSSTEEGDKKVEKKAQPSSAPSTLSEKVTEKRQKVTQEARKQAAKHTSSIETAFAKARTNLSTPKPPRAATSSPSNSSASCSSSSSSSSNDNDNNSSSSSSTSSSNNSSSGPSSNSGSSSSSSSSGSSSSSSPQEDADSRQRVLPGSLEIVPVSTPRIVQQHKKTHTTDGSEAWKFFCKIRTPDTKKEYTICMVPKCGQVEVWYSTVQVFVFHSSTKNMLDHIQKNHPSLRNPVLVREQPKLQLKPDSKARKQSLDLLYAAMCAMDFRPHDSGVVSLGMRCRAEAGHEAVSQRARLLSAITLNRCFNAAADV